MRNVNIARPVQYTRLEMTPRQDVLYVFVLDSKKKNYKPRMAYNEVNCNINGRPWLEDISS